MTRVRPEPPPASTRLFPLTLALGCALLLVAPCRAKSFDGTGVKALDGDSLLAVLANGLEVEVRLLNVDAPEHRQPLAEEAKAFLHARVAGKRLTLATDVDQRDRYNRLLALVHAGGRCVNLDLVEAGLALAYLLPPNTSRADDFLAAQARAHAARKGIWGPGSLREEPRSFRARSRSDKPLPPRPLLYENWLITGNAKSRVAHWPGCLHTEEIAPANRVRFASVKEAAAKGYRMEKGYDFSPNPQKSRSSPR